MKEYSINAYLPSLFGGGPEAVEEDIRKFREKRRDELAERCKANRDRKQKELESLRGTFTDWTSDEEQSPSRAEKLSDHVKEYGWSGVLQWHI